MTLTFDPMTLKI